MKKKSLITIVLLAAIAAAAFGIFSLFSGLKKDDFGVSFTQTVRVDENVTDPAKHTETLNVQKSGTYYITADWLHGNALPGFITGLIVKDGSGKIIFETRGALLEYSSHKLELREGPLYLELSFLSSEEKLADYLSANNISAVPGGIDLSIYRTGVWNMSYSFSFAKDRTLAIVIGMLLAVLIGVLMLILATVVSRDENGAVKQYDERQILMQGKGFKYAFYTFAAYFMLLSMALWVKIDLHVETSLLVLIGVFLGALVAFTVFVLKDAYFRADENSRVYKVFFAVLAVLNLGPGIGSIVQGKLMENGTFTFNGCANLVCLVVFCYLFVVFLVKSIIDRKEGANEES